MTNSDTVSTATGHEGGTQKPTPIVRAQALTFAYRDADAPVVDGLDLALPAGAVTAITGPSGCGKSTLLYLLALMLRPTSGEVSVNGLPTSTASDAHRANLRAREYGFVFQDAALDPTRTVLDNVIETALYRDEDRNAAKKRGRGLLDQFGVGHRADHRPGEISGGQAQRIALCRALLHRPSVIVADEPTGNLDALSTEVVLEALAAEAQRGATVVIATHESHVVAFSDRRVALGSTGGGVGHGQARPTAG